MLHLIAKIVSYNISATNVTCLEWHGMKPYHIIYYFKLYTTYLALPFTVTLL